MRTLTYSIAVLLLALVLPLQGQYNPHKRTVAVTIASGASLSGAAAIGDSSVIGVLMPAAWTAASLTFQVSVDGTNYYNLYDDAGSEVTAQASTSRCVLLEPKQFIGFRYLKIRSGTAASAVNQGGDRIITLVVRIL